MHRRSKFSVVRPIWREDLPFNCAAPWPPSCSTAVDGDSIPQLYQNCYFGSWYRLSVLNKGGQNRSRDLKDYGSQQTQNESYLHVPTTEYLNTKLLQLVGNFCLHHICIQPLGYGKI